MITKATTRSLTWPLLLAAAIGLLGILSIWSALSIIRALQGNPAPAENTAAATMPAAGMPGDAPPVPTPQPTPPPPLFMVSNPPVTDPAIQRRLEYLDMIKSLRQQARESPAVERAKLEARIQQLEESNAVPQ